MAYIREKFDGSTQTVRNEPKPVLRRKIHELLSHYSLDAILAEIASQRHGFDIHCVSVMSKFRSKPEIEEAKEAGV